MHDIIIMNKCPFGKQRRKQPPLPWVVGNDFTEEITFILGLERCIRACEAVKIIPTEKMEWKSIVN